MIFFRLEQGSLSVFEYERKFIELLRYAKVLVALESSRCRRFQRRLIQEILAFVTLTDKWIDFSQLV